MIDIFKLIVGNCSEINNTVDDIMSLEREIAKVCIIINFHFQ